jgi:hypothetical protein
LLKLSGYWELKNSVLIRRPLRIIRTETYSFFEIRIQSLEEDRRIEWDILINDTPEVAVQVC